MFISIEVEAIEIIDAEFEGVYSEYSSEMGRLLLVRIERSDIWRILDITRNKYYSGEIDSTCECYRETYNLAIRRGYSYGRCSDDGNLSFHPRNLTIRAYALKSFPTRLFQPQIFDQLQLVRVSDLGIAEFHADMLDGANILRTLDLSRNALKKLPAKAFVYAENLIEIDLSYNHIAMMPSDVFIDESENPFQPLEKLRIVRLNNNYLTFIDPNWFRYLKSLETVTLNDNLLTEIDLFSAFRNNFALRYIQLQNNKFTHIPTDPFKTELDSFDISNNTQNNGMQPIEVNAKKINITKTNSRECFIPHNAVILHAGHNRINSVTVNEIPNDNLQELYLDYNEISSADFLARLQNVQIIDLSHNSLTQMSSNVFEKMQNLTTLNIAYNKFTTINFAIIGTAMSLVHLDVSNNFLSGHFNLNGEVIALTTLNIVNNNFTSIQQNLKNYAPNLTSIDLNGNNFDCDELTSSILFLNFDHIRTVTPIQSTVKDNVKGIECHKGKTDGQVVIDRLSQDTPERSYNAMKNDMNKSLDDKLAQLENRLIQLFKNVTVSRN